MKIVKLTLTVFSFVFLSHWAQAQSETDLVGSYANGIEMGGSTLTLNSDGTFEIVDDFQGMTLSTGNWEYVEYGITFSYDDDLICDELYAPINNGNWVLGFMHPFAIEPFPVWTKID